MKGIGKLILAGIGLAVIAGIAYKKYKNTEKKLKSEKKFINEKLKEHGITQEDLERVPIENEDEDSRAIKQPKNNNNLVLMMYNVVENGCDELGECPWDRDLIRIKSKRGPRGNIECAGCLDCENIIHVKQSDMNGKEHLEFIFEIPSSAYDTKTLYSLRIKDYTESLHAASEFINTEILEMEKVLDDVTGEKTKLPFDHHIIGYYLVSYKIKGITEVDKDGNVHPKKFQKLIPIDRRDCNKFAAEINDGEKMNNTEKYVKYLYQHIKDGPVEAFKGKKVNVEFFSKELKESEGDYYDLTIEFPLLMFRIGIPIEEGGIDLDKALKCLRYFSEELRINKSGGRYYRLKDLSSGIKYDHIMFHAKEFDHTGKEGFDMLQYYTVTCEDTYKDEFRYRKLITEPLVYTRKLSKEKEESDN